MSISLLNNFETFFNAFGWIVFIRHFCDTCILHIFVTYNNVLIVNVTAIEGFFYATMRESQCDNCYIDRKVLIFEKFWLFYIIFKSYPSLLKFPEFMTLGVSKHAFTAHLPLNPPADYLATPSITSTRPHHRIKFIFYTPHPSPFFQLWPSTIHI